MGITSGPEPFQASTAFTLNRIVSPVWFIPLLCKGLTTLEIVTIYPQSILNMYRVQTSFYHYKRIHGCCNIPSLYRVFYIFYSIRIVLNGSDFYLHFD
jgi:hypothetical protein